MSLWHGTCSIYYINNLRARRGKEGSMIKILYKPDLKIVNTEHLPKGRGIKYLEVVEGQSGDYIAKCWRKKTTDNGIYIEFK